MGDDAIFGGIVLDLKEIGYTGKISLLHGGYGGSEDIYSGFEKYPFVATGIKSKLKGRGEGAMKAIVAADLIIFGGGGLFTDDESILAPLIWANQAMTCNKLGKPYIIYSQSVGPLHSFISKYLTAKAFRGARAIQCRDGESLAVLKQIGVANFAESSTDAALTWALNQLKHPKEDILLISLRLWKGLDAAAWSGCLQACGDFAQENNLKIKLLAMDSRNAKELEALRVTGHDVIAPNSASEAFAWVSKARILCSMRLHAGIFALASNTPVLMMSYSQKVPSFFTALNMTNGAEVLPMQATAPDIRNALAKLKNAVPHHDFTGPIRKNQAFLARALPPSR